MTRYVWVLLAVAAAAILSIVAVSIALDPYRIVHPLLGEFIFEPNSRVAKLEFLMKACTHYDAYFVGDSRSATLSERDLPDVLSHRFYNFSTPADDVVSIGRRVRYLLEHGCPLSALVVEESIDVLLDQRQNDTYSLLLAESPRISGESRLAFFSRYFLSAQSLSTYFWSRIRPPVSHDIYYLDGHADYLWELPDGSSFQLPRCGAGILTATQRQLLRVKLSGYRDLAQLAMQQHLNIIVWIAPLNHWKGAMLDDPDIVAFRQELHAIPGLSVVEADRQSELLGDFRQWHDCGHFRRSVFDQLLAPTVSELLVSKP